MAPKETQKAPAEASAGQCNKALLGFVFTCSPALSPTHGSSQQLLFTALAALRGINVAKRRVGLIANIWGHFSSGGQGESEQTALAEYNIALLVVV